MAVDTRTTDRRTLRFGSLADLRADLAAIERSHSAGTLRTTGNWTAGQVLNHLATWMEFCFTGVPTRPPFFIRWILKRKRKQFFEGPMPAGVRIPGLKGGTLGSEPAEFEPALRRLRAAVDRLERECPSQPHGIFGPLSHELWTGSQLRHSELHLSFLHP